MEEQNKFSSIGKLIKQAGSVIIILPPDPSEDIISAGISLHLSIKEGGKKSQIGCGSSVIVDSKIAGAKEISDSIGARNLVISFDYNEDDLEKVDYDVNSDGKFYLLVKPKVGAPVPDISNVKYSYSGAEADLVFTLGINSLEELGKIYADEKKFLDEATVVSLNISPRPATFTENLVHQASGSFSELVALLMEKVRVKPTAEAAGNLLNTIYEQSQSFSSSRMTADTFSTISFLMRSGANLPNQKTHVSGLARPPFSQPAFFEAPSNPSVNLSEFQQVQGSHSTPVDEEEIPLPEEEPSSRDENTPVPQDWIKPKIFRATDR